MRSLLGGGLLLAGAALAVWRFVLRPLPVTAHEVAAGTVAAEVMGTGTLEARVAAVLGPKYAGRITAITVDEGDRVKAGQLLIQLEDTDLAQQVKMAEADVAVAAASLERMQAARRRAEAVLAQAKSSHQRVADLAAKTVASEENVERAVEALAIAEADLSIAIVAIAEGEKQLLAAEHALAYQRARLDDSSIEAPFAGLVVKRDRDPGDAVAAAASVLQVVATDEMWVTAWVDETELSRLRDAQPARVVFRADPAREYAGIVARVGRQTDRETREVVVDVRIEQLPPQWAVGQRAEVYMLVDRRTGVTVLPAAFLQRRDGGPGVWVDAGGRARWRELGLGLAGRDTVEVVSGLQPGEVVVRTEPGAGGLREGRAIRRR